MTSNKSTYFYLCKSHNLHNLWSLEHQRTVYPLKKLALKDVKGCKTKILEWVQGMHNPMAAQLKLVLESALTCHTSIS